MKTFKENMLEWADFDAAAYYLGLSLGFFNEDSKNLKRIFWTNNKLGNRLNLILDDLVEKEFLLKREEPDIQYKWNKDSENFSEMRAYDINDV